MAAHIKQILRLKAKNRNAKYKVKFSYKQLVSKNRNILSTKYIYTKSIKPKKSKYSYKRG